MICPRCGNQLQDNETFCSNCGTPVTELAPQINTETVPTYQDKYKFTLIRKKSFVGSLVNYKIYVDNEMVGKIKNGQTVEMELTPGNHVISLNKMNPTNVVITEDTTAETAIMGSNSVGITNISGASNAGTNAATTQAVNNAGSAMKLLIICILFPIISLIMYNVAQYVISAWVYGILIGYGIVNVVGLKNKELTKEQHTRELILNIIAMAICIGAIIITMNVTI